MPAAEIPIPCCPRLMRNRWNLDPYRSFAKIFGICWRTMPGPLSETVIRKRLAWVGGGGVSPLATASTLTTTSGRIPASSQASSALSTPSLTQVSSAFRGLSNPRRCRFLVKNSETEISRCRAPFLHRVSHMLRPHFDGGDRRLWLWGRRAGLRRVAGLLRRTRLHRTADLRRRVGLRLRAGLRGVHLPAKGDRGRCRCRFSHMGLIWMQGPCHLRVVHRQNRQVEDRPVLCFPGKGDGGWKC